MHRGIVLRVYSDDRCFSYSCFLNSSTKKLKYRGDKLSKTEVINRLYNYTSYKSIYNDRELATIGIEFMKVIRDKDRDSNSLCYIPERSITELTKKYSKFNKFINTKYVEEIAVAETLKYGGKNNFKLPTRCNSVIGYAIEYYSKYLVYGKDFLEPFIEKALIESKVNTINDYIIIRACLLKYRAMMCRCFGNRLFKYIKTITVEQLIKDDYKTFCKYVIELGTRTAEFVRNTLYANKEIVDNIDPIFKTKHLVGLVDYITEDTILDVKVTNNITMEHIKQVLAYHYLSTKRSDVNIKRVIVYDAVSDNHITIDIDPKNWKENCEYGYKDSLEVCTDTII